jgi:hypothetical protein
MVVRENGKKDLDLSSYDIEYSELLALDWRKDINELELKLRCPVSGWWWKEKRNMFFRSIGFSALISDPCVLYTITLTFLGVTELTETLISQGHSILGCAPSDSTWMRSFIFDIEDIRIIRLGVDVFRFYLRAEELQLDFNFADCIFRQLCVE